MPITSDPRFSNFAIPLAEIGPAALDPAALAAAPLAAALGYVGIAVFRFRPDLVAVTGGGKSCSVKPSRINVPKLYVSNNEPNKIINKCNPVIFIV